MNLPKDIFTILVAEDEPGINQLICLQLKRSGYETLSANSGDKVIEILSDSKVDFLLLDYQLQGVTGKEIVTKLHENNTIVPFIVMTGYSDINIVIDMMKLGAIDYIVKDAQFHEVYPQKIEKAIQNLMTERMLAESKKALEKSEEEIQNQHMLLETMLNHIPDLIYIKDRNSKFLMCNSEHLKQLGVSSQAELDGKSDYDFYDDESASQFFTDEQRIIETGVPLLNKEEYKIYPNGISSWTLTSKVPIKDSNGKITGIAGINRDITTRKEQEQELIRSRYQMSVRNSISNAFLTHNQNSLYHVLLEIIQEELNSSFGYMGFINEEGDLVCPTLINQITDESMLANKDIIFPVSTWNGVWGRSLIEKKSLIKNKGFNFPKGNIELQNAMCVPIIALDELIGQIVVADKKGGYSDSDLKMMENLCNYIAPILSAILDQEKMKIQKETAFQELIEAKKKAEESDKLKSAFLLNLSHELRTPLNSIMGFSNLLVTQYEKDEKTANFANLINQSGNDLIKMVEDTIEIAKLENNEIIVELKEGDISSTILEVFNEFKDHFELSYPNLEFSLQNSIDKIRVLTDHSKLKKAISKVLDNAGKFTESGSVELGCYLNENENVIIFIKDTGIGIPEELKDAVFEKFRKIPGKDVLYRGNGLGLSISKGFLELLNGEISLISKPGNGTTVTISLPLKMEMQTGKYKQMSHQFKDAI